MCNIDWAVLGTWVQAIGGLGALYFLYRTLESQNKTLQEQQKIFRNSNMPFLSIDARKNVSNTALGGNVVNYELALKINDNCISDVVIEYKEIGSYTIDSSSIVKNNLYAKDSKLTLKMTISFLETIENMLSKNEFNVNINYCDKYGNKYSQTLILLENNRDVYLSKPLSLE